jgi:hypothetical protein
MIIFFSMHSLLSSLGSVTSTDLADYSLVHCNIVNSARACQEFHSTKDFRFFWSQKLVVQKHRVFV